MKESKNGEVGKLKQQIAHLKKENKLLRKQVRTLEGHKRSADDYIEHSTEALSLEEVLDTVEARKEAKKAAKKLGTGCPSCGSTRVKKIKTLHGVLEICSSCCSKEIVRE